MKGKIKITSNNLNESNKPKMKYNEGHWTSDEIRMYINQ